MLEVVYDGEGISIRTAPRPTSGPNFECCRPTTGRGFDDALHIDRTGGVLELIGTPVRIAKSAPSTSISAEIKKPSAIRKELFPLEVLYAV